MSDASMVSQFMVRDVVEAKLWQPVSYVRQQMLTHGFSYLPVRDGNTWRLIPEYSVARYLRGAPSQTIRRTRLANPVRDAVAPNELPLLDAETTPPEAAIAEILQHMGERPFLVIDADHGDMLVGVLASSDVL